MVTIPNTYDIYPKTGTELICPICGKKFKVTDDTRYLRKGGYVCSWKCFLSNDIQIETSVAEPVVEVETTTPQISSSATVEKFDLFSPIEVVAPKRKGRPKKQ